MLAAQHMHAYTPPLDTEPKSTRPLTFTRMGPQFDRIMREARHAGVEERRSYRRRVGGRRRARRLRVIMIRVIMSRRKPRLGLLGVDCGC